MNRREIGSITAKGGFANEIEICKKFNNWLKDEEAKLWLEIMGYNINKITSVDAVQIPTTINIKKLAEYELKEDDFEELIKFKKADAQIKIRIKIGNILKIENISLKKANSDANYNQIDKRSVDEYKKMWNFCDEIAFWLKLFTGENKPELFNNKIRKINLKDKRRIFFNEMPKNIQEKIINFFENNRLLIVNDILKGRGGLSANWILITRFNKKENTTTWILKDINTAINFFGGGEIKISPRGSLYIGRITLQRKGGTPDPIKLQFKINPCELFNIGGEENIGNK